MMTLMMTITNFSETKEWKNKGSRIWGGGVGGE